MMKSNQKGFTLIELLAVIVILAIIALIATPIVISTIANARKGAAQDSAYGAMEAVKTSFLEAQVNGTVTGNNAEFDFSSGATNSFTLTLSGTKPTGGVVTVGADGTVAIKNGSPLIIGGYTCTGNSNSVTCTAQ